jgi:hypothetical protein
LEYYSGSISMEEITFFSDGLHSYLAAGQGALTFAIDNVYFAGFAWALWTTRNKMAIEKRFPKAPNDVIYVALTLMQKWTLLKEVDREKMAHVNEGNHVLDEDLVCLT